VVIDFRSVFDLEYTALKMLTQADERLRERGVAVWLVGMSPGVLAMVNQSPLGQLMGRERMHFNLERALERYAQLRSRPQG
jgi:sulfate permease, SulP family